MPVIVLTDPAQAVPLAHALLDGGIDVMEITLRSASGLAGIESVAKAVPQMHVGAGTVTRATEMKQVVQAGARFALSPGLTPELHQAAQSLGLPFIPGAMTPSEVMQARDWGYATVKLFPAAQAGAGPLGDVRLCPTGGISADNLAEFLRQPNVSMVGGSWLVPADLIQRGQWAALADLARQATDIARSTSKETP